MKTHLSMQEKLLLLLSNEEATDVQVRHLSRCSECQSQLTALAGDSGCWMEVQASLSSQPEPRWTPDTSHSAVVVPEETALESQISRLLHAPSHPELLGRLGRYDIERVIGSGGMGIVLKAHDGDLNRPIAIKLLAPHLSHVGAARERFAREGKAAAAVVHEHVVAIHNVEADGALPFLVMQYVPGRSLQARVDEDGALGIEEMLRIGMQAAAGLAAAHAQGLVHRDVKPSNILLEDTVERAVLTDFGLARALDDASLTQTGFIAGTPHYMSPEQATGGEIDARSDLFSLGAVMYFMATGHPPFRASNSLAVLNRICHERHRSIRQHNNNIPYDLAALIDQLLDKKASRRPPSANEVCQRLASLLSCIQQHGLHRRPFDIRRSAIVACVVFSLVASVGWMLEMPSGHTTAESGSSPHTAVGNSDVLVGRETEFSTTIETTRRSLTDAHRDSFYVGNSDQEWRAEINSLRRTLDKVELDNP